MKAERFWNILTLLSGEDLLIDPSRIEGVIDDPKGPIVLMMSGRIHQVDEDWDTVMELLPNGDIFLRGDLG